MKHEEYDVHNENEKVDRATVSDATITKETATATVPEKMEEESILPILPLARTSITDQCVQSREQTIKPAMICRILMMPWFVPKYLVLKCMSPISTNASID